MNKTSIKSIAAALFMTLLLSACNQLGSNDGSKYVGGWHPYDKVRQTAEEGTRFIEITENGDGLIVRFKYWSGIHSRSHTLPAGVNRSVLEVDEGGVVSTMAIDQATGRLIWNGNEYVRAAANDHGEAIDKKIADMNAEIHSGRRGYDVPEKMEWDFKK